MNASEAIQFKGARVKVKSFMRGLGRGEATVRTMNTHVQKHQKDSRQTRGATLL